MRKNKTIEIKVCDICGGEDMPQTCQECGKDICWDHRKTHAVEYRHAVYCSGSGDAFYCIECDAKLKARGSDPKFNAYREIERLREESEAWGRNFDERRQQAEAKLAAFPKAPRV